MKSVRILFIAILVLSSIHLKAQTTNPFDCGLTYFYDASGNRVLRMIVICGGGATGRHADTSGTAHSREHYVDSTLSKFEIVLMAPNPTGGPFHITCNQNLDNATVTVIDLSGQVVSQINVSGYDVPMDISHLAPGTYQVIVSTSSSRTAKSIVKTH